MSTILQLQTLTLAVNTEELSIVLISTASGICRLDTEDEPLPFEME
jgi:hypothetical protein